MNRSKIKTTGLTKAIRQAIAACRKAHPRDKMRTIEPATAAALASEVRRLIKQARPDDTFATLVFRGGLANGRKWKSYADCVRVRVDLLAGTWTITAKREVARVSSWLLIGRLGRSGQVDGREVWVRLALCENTPLTDRAIRELQ